MNSIKEDIERLKLCSTNQCNICGRYEKEECMLERNRCEQHILSDYKRVLKDNYELKQEKINNDRMIVLAQNETLNYIQGYEDGKNSRRSAVACVVENQQYYIFGKQIERYKEYIEKLQRENEEKTTILLAGAEKVKQLEKENKDLKADNYELNNRITDLLENIPVQKIKDKIEELKKKVEELTDEKGYWGGSDLLEQIRVLQELLEKEK